MSNYEVACIDEFALKALESIIIGIEDHLHFDSHRDDPKVFRIGIDDLTVDDLSGLGNAEIFRIHNLLYGYKS